MSDWIGVDIGGTRIKAGLVTSAGRVRKVVVQETRGSVEEILATVVALVEPLLAQSKAVRGIGVGVPGIVDHRGVVYDPPNLPGWHKIPVRRLLQQHVAVPVWVENDANAAGIAELLFGVGQQLPSFLYLTWGTGIGGALILNRSLWKGAGWAGEVGHIVLNAAVPFQATSGFRTGTLEQWVGRKGIEEIARYIYYQFHQRHRSISGQQLAKAARRGKPWATAALARIAEVMGIGIASLVTVLGVPDVVIGGGFSHFPDAVFEHIRNVARIRTLPFVGKRLRIHKAVLQDKTGVLGAAALGMLQQREVS